MADFEAIIECTGVAFEEIVVDIVVSMPSAGRLHLADRIEIPAVEAALQTELDDIALAAGGPFKFYAVTLNRRSETLQYLSYHW